MARARPEPLHIVEQRLQPHEDQRVADVDRRRRPVQRVQGRPPTPRVALVFDIVVDEKGVVQQLDGHGGLQRVVLAGAEGSRRRQTEAGTEHPATAARIVGDQVVEVATRFPRPQVLGHGDADAVAVLVEHVGHERRVFRPHDESVGNFQRDGADGAVQTRDRG